MDLTLEHPRAQKALSTPSTYLTLLQTIKIEKLGGLKRSSIVSDTYL